LAFPARTRRKRAARRKPGCSYRPWCRSIRPRGAGDDAVRYLPSAASLRMTPN